MLKRSVNACPRTSGSEGILPTQSAATDGGMNVGSETDYSLSTTAARDAIRHRRQFHIIHVPTGLKLDLNQRKTTEFGTIDITQSQRLKSDGHYDSCFDSPENVVLMKLRYCQEGGTENICATFSQSC